MSPRTAARAAPHNPARPRLTETRLLHGDGLSDSTKSPLRYPGGKSRAVKKISQYLPAHLKTLASPFLGGGSVELACAAAGITVYASDAFYPVVEFWQTVQTAPQQLAAAARQYHPLSREQFYHLQKTFSEIDTVFERAVVFYVLNRCSFSGLTLSGGMSPGHPRFTTNALTYLHDFRARNLEVCHADYKEALARHTDKFLYLDPPYANGGNLYGVGGDMHKGFDHADLAAQLHSRTGWVLSYNDCEAVRELYGQRGYQLIKPEWTYGMNNNRGNSDAELLIVNV